MREFFLGLIILAPLIFMAMAAWQGRKTGFQALHYFALSAQRFAVGVTIFAATPLVLEAVRYAVPDRIITDSGGDIAMVAVFILTGGVIFIFRAGMAFGYGLSEMLRPGVVEDRRRAAVQA